MIRSHPSHGGVRPSERPRKSTAIALFLALAGALPFAIGCANLPQFSPPHLPRVSEEVSDRVSAGKFVWVDLVTQDTMIARTFYGELFGWTFDAGDRYTKILQNGRPIGGIVSAREPERASEWVGNLSVIDVDLAAETVAAHGGVIERGPVDAPDRGRLGLVSDAEGALLLLVRSSSGDPADAQPDYGEWLWWELWTHDVGEAERFYGELAGYSPNVVVFRNESYHVLEMNGIPRAGIVQAPDSVTPLWLPYVRVEDAQRIAERAVDLGARLVAQDEQSAIFVDPTGAPIGVQAWIGSGADGEEAAP